MINYDDLTRRSIVRASKKNGWGMMIFYMRLLRGDYVKDNCEWVTVWKRNAQRPGAR